MRALHAAGAIVLAMAAGCDRSPTGPTGAQLSGTWAARGSGHTGMGFVLRLQQTGYAISGTACGADGGITLFRDAPVQGRYPTLGFTVTSASAGERYTGVGLHFSGTQDGTGDIVGTLDGGLDLRFVRGAGGVC